MVEEKSPSLVAVGRVTIRVATLSTMQSLSCANCGVDEGEGECISLKACKSCMLVKYCNPTCQLNHWPKHKKLCKQRAAELHDEALFKEPPPKEDCPICLPMPRKYANQLCHEYDYIIHANQ